jgi:hypothetical protein
MERNTDTGTWESLKELIKYDLKIPKFKKNSKFLTFFKIYFTKNSQPYTLLSRKLKILTKL